MLETHLDALIGPTWRAENIDLVWRRGERNSLRATARRLQVLGDLPPLRGLELECAEFTLAASRVSCATGRLNLKPIQDRNLSGKVNFTYDTDGDRLAFMLTDVNLARGRLTLRGGVENTAWRLAVEGKELDTAELSAWWPTARDRPQSQGRLNLTARLSGRGSRLDQLDVELASQALTLSAAGGRYATQDLAFGLTGEWRNGRFSTVLNVTAGQAYLQPFFLEPLAGQVPITLRARGRWQDPRLRLDALSLNHPGVVEAEGGATIGLGKTIRLRRLDLTVNRALFPAAYTTYLQPWLIDTALGELTTTGWWQGRFALADGVVQRLNITLDGVAFDDAQGRFKVQGMRGRLDWASDDHARRSELRWDTGHLYRLALGAGSLTLVSQGDRFRLPGQARLPLMDGAILIERLEGRGLGAGQPSWHFDGRLTPVSLEAVSQALGWPRLAGTLAGEIPGVRYADRRIQVGGNLVMRVFDGDVTITNLRIDDPLGSVPRVFADLAVNDLNLTTLTNTFDVGKIEGKLAGFVRDLHLENWQPVRFEAELATPAGDESRRRISQRAVETISALGGPGASAALSRGFIGMFESFAYRRLGIRCRLANGVCTMDGVAPAGEGYYLVEGAGIPRLDVIGYTRQVDWRELLTRLQAAARSEGPVIQ